MSTCTFEKCEKICNESKFTCSEHKGYKVCCYGECMGITKNELCPKHECVIPSCKEIKLKNLEYCCMHLCPKEGCNKSVLECLEHSCNYSYCRVKKDLLSNYCKIHWWMDSPMLVCQYRTNETGELESCMNKQLKFGKFCSLHTCSKKACYNRAIHNSRCPKHVNA